mmetsp:Transcript_54013/g.153069  ORF Transcript_54013/g.153069 Transcript_54013/m.153069 type:complete len:319 (+) Transcript_54013:331-1287(+)
MSNMKNKTNPLASRRAESEGTSARDVEGCECKRDVWVVLLVVLPVPRLVLRACLAALAEHVREGLAHRDVGARLGSENEGGKARRHAEAQHALHEDPHSLDVRPCDHGVRPRRLVQASDQLVLTLHRVLKLLTLHLQLPEAVIAVLEVPCDDSLLAAMLLESFRSRLEHQNAPQAVSILVIQARELPGGQRDDFLNNGLVARQELLISATGKDHHDGRDVLCVDEVVICGAINLHHIRRQHIHQVAARHAGTLLLRQIALRSLELVVLRSLVARLLIQLGHHGHQQGQVVQDRAGLRILGLVPLPILQVLQEGLLLAL